MIVISLLLLSACSNKTNSETSKNILSLQVHADAIQKQNLELKKKLLKLEEKERGLKLQLAEWEGLAPHQGIGEIWVEGKVIALDEKKRIITIEQHFDDNSIKVDPHIYVLPQAFIQERLIEVNGPIKILGVKNRSDSLSKSIKTGDIVSLVYRQVDNVAKFVRVDSVQKMTARRDQ